MPKSRDHAKAEAMATIQEWLLANPGAWHGWPFRSLLIEDFDRTRLDAITARMGSENIRRWFGQKVANDRPLLYSHISSEIADTRLLHRREYADMLNRADREDALVS